MYKLAFFVPEEHASPVKQAVFSAGAGRIGQYQECCWQTSGVGQFRPQEGADPFIGIAGKLEIVAELRIEMVCDDDCILKVLEALKHSHPYEEPAYDVWKLADL